MARSGRPTKYTRKLALEICRRIAVGETLSAICAEDGFPNIDTIYTWIFKSDSKNPVYGNFSELYARARQLQGQTFVDQMKEIADRPLKGTRTSETVMNSWTCPVCERECQWSQRIESFVHSDDRSGLCSGVTRPLRTRIVTGTETVVGDNTARADLMIKTRMWLSGKLAPKKYGEGAGKEDSAEDQQGALDELINSMPDLPPPPEWVSPEKREEMERDRAAALEATPQG